MSKAEGYAWVDESNYYYIKIENEPEADGETQRRTLVLDNLIHGYFILGHPERLDYDYEHIYALVAYRAAQVGGKVVFKTGAGDQGGGSRPAAGRRSPPRRPMRRRRASRPEAPKSSEPKAPRTSGAPKGSPGLLSVAARSRTTRGPHRRPRPMAPSRRRKPRHAGRTGQDRRRPAGENDPGRGREERRGRSGQEGDRQEGPGRTGEAEGHDRPG